MFAFTTIKQRTEEALQTAQKDAAEHAAARDEKEQWSLLFAKVVKEEKLATRLKRQGKGGDEGGDEHDESVLSASPLAALRLLREIQEEKTAMVKVYFAYQGCSGTLYW